MTRVAPGKTPRALVIIILIEVFGAMLLSVPGADPWMQAILGILLVVGLVGIAVIGIRGVIRRCDHARGEQGLCVRCGYLLHGLSEPRCPECGTPFRLRQ